MPRSTISLGSSRSARSKGRSRLAWLVALVLAAAGGYWIAGPALYKTFIGLDADAFPFGARIEGVKTHPTWPDEWKGAHVRAYRRLGRTGFEVSDISLGTGAIKGENGEGIVREAAVDDVLRYRMYFEDYGWEKRGIQQYAQLGKNVSVCLGCTAPCTDSCPVGIPIQQRLLEAHELLSIG